jgi:hypothetical protein
MTTFTASPPTKPWVGCDLHDLVYSYYLDSRQPPPADQVQKACYFPVGPANFFPPKPKMLPEFFAVINLPLTGIVTTLGATIWHTLASSDHTKE